MVFRDAVFALSDRSVEQVFFAEINATERMRSPKVLDSSERKIRLYHPHQKASGTRFRVLVGATRRTERTARFAAAATLMSDPRCLLHYGIGLPTYLNQCVPLEAAGIRDHHGKQVAMFSKRLFVPPASSPLSVRRQYCPSQDLDLRHTDADNGTLESLPDGLGNLTALELSVTAVRDEGPNSLSRPENVSTLDPRATRATAAVGHRGRTVCPCTVSTSKQRSPRPVDGQPLHVSVMMSFSHRGDSLSPKKWRAYDTEKNWRGSSR